MKQQRKAKEMQAKLFFDLRSVSSPVPLGLPADRQVELQRLIGELLLKVVRENAEVPRGGECDE
jgi:hypothetical protein